MREWDAEILAADAAYEAYTGERLAKIRDALKPVHGLWTAYLQARGIPYDTANDRIRKAEGRPHLRARKHGESPAFPDATDTIAVPREELRRLELPEDE